MKSCATPDPALPYPNIREASRYGERSAHSLPLCTGDPGHHSSVPVELHLHLLDLVRLIDKRSSVDLCPAGGYPGEPLIPVEHVAGTAIYVEVVLGEERLKHGGISFLKGTSKGGDSGSDFLFWHSLLGDRRGGCNQ